MDEGRRGVMRFVARALCAGALVPFLAGQGSGQELADYDYENLGSRGIGLEAAYIIPDNVDETYGVGIRLDLGYLGPGFRIVPSMTYWSSDLKSGEVSELEDRLEDLVVQETPPGTPRPDLTLGPVSWSDLAFTIDGHFVWSIPLGFLGYAGAGGSAHFMNGEGTAISGTFIEDLLDSVRAGINLHVGLERSIQENFRVYSTAKYELLGDLQYWDLRLGGQIFWGEPAEGEAP